MAERKIAWKPRDENVLLGTYVDRIDGPDKASGAAKYAADINTEGTLYAKVLSFKGAHGRITRLDIERAKRVKGVRAVHVLRAAFFPGTACHAQRPVEGRCAAKPVLSVVEGQSSDPPPVLWTGG